MEMDKPKPKRRTDRCPNCQSADTAKIIYGYIGLDDGLEQKLESGRAYLGGCEVSDDEPIRHCNKCMHDY